MKSSRINWDDDKFYAKLKSAAHKEEMNIKEFIVKVLTIYMDNTAPPDKIFFPRDHKVEKFVMEEATPEQLDEIKRQHNKRVEEKKIPAKKGDAAKKYFRGLPPSGLAQQILESADKNNGKKQED